MRVLIKKSVLICLVLFLSQISTAQNIKLISPISLEFSRLNKDSMKREKLVDSINHPLTYLLYKRTKGTYYLASQKSKKWFNVFEVEGVSSIDSVQQVNINNTSKNEIFLYDSESYGSSGAGGGVSAADKSLFIYDLKKMKLIFRSLYYSEVETWETYYEVDSSAVNKEVVVPESEYYCDCYSIKIDGRKIIFEPVDSSRIENENLEYLWTKKGFVKL